MTWNKIEEDKVRKEHVGMCKNVKNQRIFKNEPKFLRDEEMYEGAGVLTALQTEADYKNQEAPKSFFFYSQKLFNNSCHRVTQTV